MKTLKHLSKKSTTLIVSSNVSETGKLILDANGYVVGVNGEKLLFADGIAEKLVKARFVAEDDGKLAAPQSPDIKKMNKAQLVAFAKERFGIELSEEMKVDEIRAAITTAEDEIQ